MGPRHQPVLRWGDRGQIAEDFASRRTGSGAVVGRGGPAQVGGRQDRYSDGEGR